MGFSPISIGEVAHRPVERMRMEQHDLACLHWDGCSTVHIAVIIDHDVPRHAAEHEGCNQSTVERPQSVITLTLPSGATSQLDAAHADGNL